MQDIKVVYEQLTGIDIDEQRHLWTERGKGYFGEYLMFSQLFYNVKGDCKLLMNLQLPTQQGKTTEIDLLLIHETGIYVFEAKHFKGKIYGRINDPTWTQYFRTAPNHAFKNPILQNNYHIEALAKWVSSPIYSVIVFTDDDCELQIKGENPEILVTRHKSMMYQLDRFMDGKSIIYDREEINRIFAIFSDYSPMKTVSVSVKGTEIPFYEYLGQIQQDVLEAKERFENQALKLEQERRENQLRWAARGAFKKTEKTHSLEKTKSVQENDVPSTKSVQENDAPSTFRGEYTTEVQRLKNETARYNEVVAATEIYKKNLKKRAWLIALCCVLVSAAVCAMFYQVCRNHYDSQLAEYEKTFLRIEEMDDEVIQGVNRFVRVSNVQLVASSDIEDAVVFSCRLTNTSEKYGITINSDATYVVMTTEGMTYEYPVFGNHLNYNPTQNKIGHKGSFYPATGDLAEATFYKMKRVEDISYIKLTGIAIWQESKSASPLAKGCEVKLYSKE